MVNYTISMEKVIGEYFIFIPNAKSYEAVTPEFSSYYAGQVLVISSYAVGYSGGTG